MPAFAQQSASDAWALAYGLVALALVFATVAAWNPRALGRLWTPALGFVGMLVAFFLPQVVLLGVATTLAAFLLGAFAQAGAFVALGAHVACWIALGLLLARMRRALPVLDGAEVRDADQPFVGGLTEDELRLLPAGRVTWAPTLFLRTAARARARVTRGVEFRRVGEVVLRLDVYRPRDEVRPRPALLYVHGGAWFTGTRAQSRFLLYELAAAGWTVFSISYRLAPRFALAAAVEDCKAAVAWVRAHAGEFGADGARVFVLGGSAGGHLAAMLALTPNAPALQPGFEAADTRVDGAVVLYGVTDLTGAFGARPHAALRLLLERVVVQRRFREAPDAFRALDPLAHAGPGAPPMLLVHGRADGLVPIRHSRLLHERLREAGAGRVHLVEVPLAHHAFEVFPTPLHQRAVRIVVRFLESLRSADRPGEAARAERSR